MAEKAPNEDGASTNRPVEKAQGASSSGGPASVHSPFSMRANLARRHAEFEGGPTMAEILADLDRFRRPDGPTRDDIVRTLQESRDERAEQIEATWRR
jgi:hypothetical protein